MRSLITIIDQISASESLVEAMHMMAADLEDDRQRNAFSVVCEAIQRELREVSQLLVTHHNAAVTELDVRGTLC